MLSSASNNGWDRGPAPVFQKNVMTIKRQAEICITQLSLFQSPQWRNSTFLVSKILLGTHCFSNYL